jgi:alpha-tubulin suppressor-like RCC1 family protein
LPQRVQALEPYFVTKVICGTDQTYCITESENERHCFSWGCNQHAKLGHSFSNFSKQENGF